jgi:hypothetical protein
VDNKSFLHDIMQVKLECQNRTVRLKAAGKKASTYLRCTSDLEDLEREVKKENG